MDPFLSQVAKHYFEQGNCEWKCFIFPNRRSIKFFGKYLSECVVRAYRRAMMAPKMMTINDFFYKASGFAPAGRVTLLLELYKCYKDLYAHAESLDDFIFWGDMLLADFDDVDKYLVDAKSLFANVADFKELGDDLSHLNDEQRKAVEDLRSHFRNYHPDGSTTHEPANSRQGNVKDEFVKLWNILYNLYDAFNRRLNEQGLSYEGMVYRNLADRVKNEPVKDILDGCLHCGAFVFVGLNALNECEKTVLGKMRDAGMAEFCWDYCSKMIRNEHNKSSLFMRQNVKAFPQAFDLEYDTDFVPEVHVVSVPSSVGQVKYVPEILSQIAREKADGNLSKVGQLAADGTDCAIVLPDESLLPYMLNTIPPEIGDVNVTMGYPMTSSECYLLLMDLIQAQLQMLKKGEEPYFYHKPVHSLFSNAVLRSALGREDADVAAKVKKELKYYVPASDFKDAPLLSRIFRPVVTDANANDPEQIKNLEQYLLDALLLVSSGLRKNRGLVLEPEFVMKCYYCINDLKGHELAVLPKTYKLLLSRILSGQNVHFKGEPLKGLQIMGPLETRALDFTHLIILSCNDDMFPRKSAGSSFVPAELRKSFGLPTYEYQDAVWAYYFYRMIQRAEKVWMLADSRTGGMNTGDESRYIKQLEYHFGMNISRTVVVSCQLAADVDDEIRKPADIADKMKKLPLSASSIQDYLRCPAKFYYSKICELSDEDEVVENADARIVGTVYHATMQALYLGDQAMEPDFDMDRKKVEEAVHNEKLTPRQTVDLTYLDHCLSPSYQKAIKDKVRALMMSELNTVELKGRNLVIEEVIVEYVRKTLWWDKQLLTKKQLKEFKVLGLEKEIHWQFGGYNFIGYIDRVDSFEPGCMRVVDYKTGKVDDKEMDINADNYESIIQTLYDPDAKKKNYITVQVFLYNMFVQAEKAYEGYRRVDNSIYSIAELFRSGIIERPMCEPFNVEMQKKLKETLDEISDPSIPFRRTKFADNCKWCNFKKICRR